MLMVGDAMRIYKPVCPPSGTDYPARPVPHSVRYGRQGPQISDRTDILDVLRTVPAPTDLFMTGVGTDGQTNTISGLPKTTNRGTTDLLTARSRGHLNGLHLRHKVCNVRFVALQGKRIAAGQPRMAAVIAGSPKAAPAPSSTTAASVTGAANRPSANVCAG